MSSINFASKEISVKIVFYGPGLCGKTTTLQHVYSTISPDRRPKMVSLATDVDRTIFFDFLPVTASKVNDFLVRLQLYTVPGQVFYNSTRKLVLNGADGVVFVADSQKQAIDANLESYRNLKENLKEQGVDLANMPHILQFNKRDLEDIMTEEELNKHLNEHDAPYFNTIATNGDGVIDALKEISRLVLADLNKKGLNRKLKQPQKSTSSDAPTEAVEPMVPGISANSPMSSGFNDAYQQAAAPDSNNSDPSGSPDSSKPVEHQITFAAVWRTPALQDLAATAETKLKTSEGEDILDTLNQLWEASLRFGLPSEAEKWDLAQCALYKGIPGHLYRDITAILADPSRAQEYRTLYLIYFYTAIAIDGWGTLHAD